MQSGMGQSGMQSGMGGMNAARGSSALAGSLLFLLGVFHFFAGIAGFARRNFYTVGSTYPYHLSSNGWGWLYVIGGVLLVLTGLALFGRSNTWARPVGLVLAVLSAVGNFFFLPFFPLWAFLMLATALFAIGALVADGQTAQISQQQGQMSGQRMGTQQAGSYTTQPSGTSGAGQTGQRWPENVGARDESGRQWAPQDVKDTANRAQEQAQAGARSSGQTARNQTDDAADRARQAAGQAAGQAQNYRPNPNR
jgi:hypothetical protein